MSNKIKWIKDASASVTQKFCGRICEEKNRPNCEICGGTGQIVVERTRNGKIVFQLEKTGGE